MGRWGKWGGHTASVASFNLLDPQMISSVTCVESVLNVTKVFVNPRHLGEKPEGIV